MSGIDIGNLTVAVEINDEGNIQQIVVYAGDKDTAEMLTRSIDTLGFWRFWVEAQWPERLIPAFCDRFCFEFLVHQRPSSVTVR